MIRRYLLLAFMLLVCLPAMSLAANRFAAPNGTGSSPCTSSTTRCPLQTALNTLAAGDTLFLQGGVYSGGVNGFNIPPSASGTSNSLRTVIRVDDGADVRITPVLGLTGGNGADFLTITGEHGHLHIEGTENADRPCFGGDDGANAIIVKDVEISHCDQGILVGGASNWQLLNLHAHHIGIGDDGVTRTCFQDKGGGKCHAMYLGGSNFLIDGGFFHDLDGHTVHCAIQTSLCQNIIVRNTTNLRIGGLYAIGIYYGVTNPQIYNNVVAHVGNMPSNLQAGVGILVDSVPAAPGFIANNTIYDTKEFAIRPEGNLQIRNNIAYANPGGLVGAIQETPTYATNLCQAAGTGCTVVNSNAGNVFTSVPSDDFHLRAGSPALDVGTDLSATFTTDLEGCQRGVNGAWDLGAYERNTTGCGTPPVNPNPIFTFTAVSPVDTGQPTTLNWSVVQNANTCVAEMVSGTDTNWTGTSAGELLVGGSKTSTALTSPRTYRMRCTNVGGQTIIDQPVSVNPIPQGRLAWLKLDGNLLDSDGGFPFTGAGGVLTNGAPLIDSDPVTAGMQGNSGVFDGVNDQILGPNDPAFRPSKFCFATWLNTTTAPVAQPNGVARIMSIGTAAILGMRDDGLLYLDITGNGVPPSPARADDGLNHLAVGSYDGTVLRLWVDNANVSSVNTGGSALSYGANDVLAIGGVSGRFYTGRLDNVRMKDEPCTASDVQQYFTESVPVLSGVQSTHSVFTAANQPEGTGFSAVNGSITHVLSLPVGFRANLKRNGSNITEFFPLYARTKPIATGVWGTWTRLTNSFGSLGVRIATDTAVNMGDATVIRLPTGGFLSTPGRIIADTINTALKTTLADGTVTEWEGRVDFGSPLVAGDAVQFKFYRENDTALDSYAAADDLLPMVTLAAPPSQKTVQGLRVQGGMH